MKQLLRNLIRAILKPTGFDIASCQLLRYYEHRARLPPPSNFPCIQLALAWFFESGMTENAVMIQIGANDGKSNDLVFPFLRTGRIRAILVEPLPWAFAELQKTYSGCNNIEFVNAAIDKQDNPSSKFYMGTEILNHQAASFSKDHVKNHLRIRGKDPTMITEVNIKTISYASLLSTYNIQKVDIVQVDAESHDDTIVKMILDHNAEAPKLINFEHTSIPKERADALFDKLKIDYVWIHDSENTLAIRRDISEHLSTSQPSNTPSP